MRIFKYKYFQFPLVLLQKVHENSDEGLNQIISYGLVDFSSKLPNRSPEYIEDWQVEWWDNGHTKRNKIRLQLDFGDRDKKRYLGRLRRYD